MQTTGILAHNPPRNASPGPDDRNRQRGVTLFELMVGLAIVSILAFVAVPNFRSFLGNQKRVAATGDLIAALYLARNEALKRSRHVTVCRSPDGQACAPAAGDWRGGWIVFANTARNNVATLDQGEELIRVFPPLDDDVTFVSPDGLGGIIAYRPTGDLDVAGTLIYCDGRGKSSARAVVVERSGRAQTSSTELDGGQLSCE